MKVFTNKQLKNYVEKSTQERYDRGYKDGWAKGNNYATSAWQKEFNKNKDQFIDMLDDIQDKIAELYEENNSKTRVVQKRENINEIIENIINIISEDKGEYYGK